MKKLLIVVALSLLFGSYPLEVKANTWNQLFITDDKPNLVNLWSSKDIQGLTIDDQDWDSWVSSDDSWAQGQTTAYSYGTKDIYLTMSWNEPKSEELYFAAQEIHYNFSTGTAVNTYNYGLYWDGTNWHGGGIKVTPGTVYASYFETAGGEYDAVEPVPEPSSIIMFILGILGLFISGRKKILPTSR